MSLRPQDLVASMALAVRGELSYPQFSEGLCLSLSEAHGAVRRATAAGLVFGDRQPQREAILEFVLHGMRYAFYPERGRMTRGMPTAHGAPPLDQVIAAGNEPIPVWPDAEGNARGEAFSPLYKSAPKAASRDADLYQMLCLLDAIRGGRARDRRLAEVHVREIFEASAS